MTFDIAGQLQAIWEDQRAFNLLLRKPPQSEEELADQVSAFVLYTTSELHELLRAVPWKKHRKVPVLENHAHLEEEGMDTFKCVLSILQIIGVENWEQLIELYWRKTAVVRQRYQEEWIAKIDGPCVIVDIDNVLCDYITGFLDWLEVKGHLNYAVLNILRTERPYLNAQSVGVTPEQWMDLKHQFRVSGAKRQLPLFPDAFMFLHRMRCEGFKIILLTSRPIDRYPNIFTDTIMWLNYHRLPYDFVWWSLDKHERLVQVKDIKQYVRFAVDDDCRFVEQFASIGIKTFWLNRDGLRHEERNNVTQIESLSDIKWSFTS
jgi:NTP pyrophosphatase (non-canonical NTP hydrolase)